MRAGRCHDQAIGRVSVKSRRQGVQSNHHFGIEGQNRDYIGMPGTTQPLRERQGQFYPFFQVKHLGFP